MHYKKQWTILSRLERLSVEKDLENSYEKYKYNCADLLWRKIYSQYYPAGRRLQEVFG